MNQSSFLRTSLRFHSALAILEHQLYVVVEQFGVEIISLLSGRLVFDQNEKRYLLKCIASHVLEFG